MYKYDYIDKIGKFYHKSRAGNSFGATLHQALQQFHEAGGAAVENAEDLTARAIASWRSAGFADEVEEAAHKELAVEVLQIYHAQAIERADAARVFLSEKMLKFDMGPFLLSGRIDRIDEHVADGALEIIDYKSGRFEVTEEQVRNALAMSIYQLLAKRLYPDRRVFATIVALRSGTSASVELSDAELDVWEDEIRDIGRQIIEKDWDAVRPIYLPDVCATCDFFSRCSRYWKSRPV
jgi:RecB family exonuclease